MKLNSSIIPKSVKGKIEPKFPSETENVTKQGSFLFGSKNVKSYPLGAPGRGS